MIASIWTCGRPTSGQGARRYGSRNTGSSSSGEALNGDSSEIHAAQTSLKPDRLSSEAVLGSYFRFQGNQ
jgi:hypothetical protein